MLTGLSDHNITLMVRKLTRKRFANTKSNLLYETIPKNELNNLENAIKGTDWSTILDNEDTEDSCCTFLNTISEIITVPPNKRTPIGSFS